ncbi:MAG TPA: rod shape-determining protein MreC [Steroidobacteraceae bacterium]|nr:rod shape-determining protein MreC [Steroidobacteraceae bacterium]
MATLSSDSRPIIGRGPSLGLRFFVLALLCVALMVLDQRQAHLERVRGWLSVATHPVIWVVEAPFRAWDWLAASFADRIELRERNAQLEADLRVANLRLQRFAALEEENRRLRDIREASTGVADRTLVAAILRIDLDPFRHRVRIDKGVLDGVYKGQPLLDAYGVFGQVVDVGRHTAEAILISDAEHAIPVQVNRSGLRTIAMGTGDLSRLSLPFLTVDADLKQGDLLVSSGMGGVFPRGYPVATISKIDRNAAAAFASVEAMPLAALDRDSEVLLIWPQATEGVEIAAGSPDDTPVVPEAAP